MDSGDGYLDLSEKILKIFAHSLANFEFQYLLKCDDNALIFPGQLQRVIADSPDYTGNVVTPPWFSRCWHYGKLDKREKFSLYDVPYLAPYAQGGSGYIIKKEHIERIVRTAEQIDTTREFYEDKMVGDALHQAGIVPRHRKHDFVPRGNWQPDRIPLTLKCRSQTEMKRYSFIATAPTSIRQAYFLVRRLYRRIRRILMNRGYLDNPYARGEGGFVVCRQKRFLVINIPKNSSRTILKTIYEMDVGSAPPRDIHGFFGYKIDGRHRIPIQTGLSHRFKHYVRFAVYRDPVERLLSLYRDKVAVLRSERSQSYYLEQGIVGCSFDNFLTFVEHELQKPTAEIDEHVRRQIHFFRHTDVDWIVPLDRLSAFMTKILGVEPKAVTDANRGAPCLFLQPNKSAASDGCMRRISS